MSKLTRPESLQPSSTAVEEICTKLETAFAKPGGDKFDIPVDNNAAYHIKTIHIDGVFESSDCREVCQRYKEIGWDDVQHRRLPWQTVGEKQTSFSFRRKK